MPLVNTVYKQPRLYCNMHLSIPEAEADSFSFCFTITNKEDNDSNDNAKHESVYRPYSYLIPGICKWRDWPTQSSSKSTDDDESNTQYAENKEEYSHDTPPRAKS
jgi:hypothetical protein